MRTSSPSSPSNAPSQNSFSATAVAANTTTATKGFQVTHTSFSQATPPFRTSSPPVAPAAFVGPRPGGAALLPSPLQSPTLPASKVATVRPTSAPFAAGRSPSSSSSTHSGVVSTPPLAPRTAVVPLITPRYQKKSRANRHMNVTDSFPQQQTPPGALRQETTEQMTIQSGPQQYSQDVHFHTYDVFRHGKHQIHTRSVGYSSDGDLVMTREDYSEPSDVDNNFTRKRTEISEPTVLDPRARRPLTDQEMEGHAKLHLSRPRYKKYPGIRIPKNRKVRNRLLNDYFAHELARDILMKAQEFRKSRPKEPVTTTAPSFRDLPKAVIRAFDLEGEEQLMEFERLHVHPDAVAPQVRNVRPPPHPDSPEGRVQGLNTRLRGELQHALNSEFLTHQIDDLEVHFTHFIQDNSTTPESLVFYFKDGYGRLICHGVAAYYLLVSESRTVMDGSGVKLTYVSLPKSRRHGVRAVNPPQVPLLMVLKRNRRNLPAKHSLSCQTTPQIAPAADPALPPPLVMGAGEASSIRRPDPDEVMSPLMLGPSSMSRTSSGGEGAGAVAVPLTPPTSELLLDNPTVFCTVNGKLPVGGPLPLYVPTLHMVLSAEQQESASEQLDALSAAVTPVLAPATPPLTATQRKKMRTAAAEPSPEASQDEISSRR
ncbi:hypothetical protein ABB37_03336 [Leptomonas pyrrhocoris]|uniref:R3H-associated N-terminal domain-containing protein n=1 Tax=Leptomonas pyrrhocoris TaxID=157538 RepID=A0A0M9G4R3_LEPPY|nr:hypothetical protein ABB37_03336 [Leptomonas pyrrhocoris]KPA82217.1 hypothetical protein ABB37_03336 [Leptomonas pyrrhocoris]|eukprot:XP_015660656.1 hypothetical protein ABB37_03336 [Leptomonas pyrrhocoris]